MNLALDLRALTHNTGQSMLSGSLMRVCQEHACLSGNATNMDSLANVAED